MEQTLSIIKPDAVERDLENKIKDFFETNNLKISKSKKVKISKEEASEFYKVHQSKPFYDKLCDYLSSGPIVVMILEGENAVHKNRQLMGATDPLKAEEGSLRNFYMSTHNVIAKDSQIKDFEIICLKDLVLYFRKKRKDLKKRHENLVNLNT